MTFSIHGLAVARGIAIGRAVLVASSRVDVAHYFIEPARSTRDRPRAAWRNAVVEEIHRLQQTISHLGPKDAPHELSALLDVHLMLLQDEELISGVKHWITDRLYNAEWALTTQLEMIARQFDEMEDEYLRERKADLEQIAENVLRAMKGVASPACRRRRAPRARRHSRICCWTTPDVPLVLIAHDLSPADMLQFKQSVFAGFVTDVGGKTSHTAIVARSMDIPAVVGARTASQLVRQDDWVIIDGDAGVVIVDPSPIILAEYGFKQRQGELERGRLARLLQHAGRHAGRPEGRAAGQHRNAGGCAGGPEGRRRGRGPVPQRVPVHGPPGQAARRGGAVPGLPPRGRGHAGPAGHHPHGGRRRRQAAGRQPSRDDGHLNPALGLRAIRWSLADPAMFLTQLRAILRAAAHGPVNLLIPMLAHASEIRQTLALIDQARAELDNARRGPTGRSSWAP